MAKFDLKEYAREGARARVAELQAELASIYRAFPDLRRGGPRAGGAADRPSEGRRRRAMSPAQRKAVSARMKKYWADRRKASAAK